MPRTHDLPASNFVRFLMSYGPDASNANLFDEMVALLAKRYQIPPFELKTEYVDKIIALLRRPAYPASILIAGVAGDGKSYHMRQVWKALGGEESLWGEDGDKELVVPLEDGTQRNVFFVKDLSAYEATSFLELWCRVEASSKDPSIAFVIACNHGQILSRLRETTEFEALADALEDTFFQCDTEKKIKGLHIFDLSRTSQSAKLEEITRLVCTHPRWGACEEKVCSFLNCCPIRRNLARLWNPTDDTPMAALRRLCRVVEIAGCDGAHFPIRELYLLVVNAILGVGQPKNLANCHYVKKFCEGTQTKDLDLYGNILGLNLNPNRRQDNVLFRALSQFEIGHYGDHYFDELILLGENHSDPEMRQLHAKYLGDLPSPPAAADATRATYIERARRILFFTWSEPHHEQNLWGLTAYKHAPQYLRMKEEAKEEDQIEQLVIDGLNRIMTGSTVNNGKLIQISTNGADSRAPIGLLVVGRVDAGRDYNGIASIVFDAKGADAVPSLVFGVGNHSEDESCIRFALTPRRYEFLVCLAEGYLSTSFSSQCQAEFYSLKAKLVRAADRCARKRGKAIRLDLIDKSSITIRTEAPKEN